MGGLRRGVRQVLCTVVDPAGALLGKRACQLHAHTGKSACKPHTQSGLTLPASLGVQARASQMAN